jgi:hypothetical protein
LLKKNERERERVFDYHNFKNQDGQNWCQRVLFDERSSMIMVFGHYLSKKIKLGL